MPSFDMPLEELERYLPFRGEPKDFDNFWSETLSDASAVSLNPVFTPVDAGLQTVDAYDLEFCGYGGHPVRGWFLLPRTARGPHPCVVQYLGYTGGRGSCLDWLLWPSLGFACLVMDTRGQGGSNHHPGSTSDVAPAESGPYVPGFMTQGILDPQAYYYRRVFVDAFRAVKVAQEHVAVDPERIAALGASQGGGIALAVAGLDRSLKVVLPDVPFLCNFRRATDLVDTKPYAEITEYLTAHRDASDDVFRTLSYFDGMNFASRARARAVFSVGLADTTCPPSTVYAAFNHYAGPKEIVVYRYNNHEGGGPAQRDLQVKLLREELL